MWSRGIFLAIAKASATARTSAQSIQTLTNLREDLDDSLSRLGTRLKEEQTALLGILLCLLPRNLPPTLTSSDNSLLISSLRIIFRRSGRIVRLVVVRSRRGGGRRLVRIGGRAYEVNLVTSESDDDAVGVIKGEKGVA